jgi:hypothetical protein
MKIWKSKILIQFASYVDGKMDIIFRILFMLVFALVLVMAVTSKFNAHPDEAMHYEAVEYYRSHYFPPHLQDPEIAHTFSVYGHSRLINMDAYYSIAGKFSLLASLVIEDTWVAARMLNVFLFFFLGLMFITSRQTSAPLFLVLLLTPQIWYIFSYCNSDAFGLFLSVLLVHQLINPQSFFRKFLSSDKVSKKLFGALFMALIASLLFLSKKNYWVVLLFVFGVLIHALIVLNGNKWVLLKKYLIVFTFALLMIAPRYAYNALMYDFNFQVIKQEHKEKVAHDPFKRSNMNKENSYKGIFLKDKGVSYTDLFSEKWNWHWISFNSMVGIYGYMNVNSSESYYRLMLFLYLLLIIVFGHRYLMHLSLNEWWLPAYIFLMSLLTVFLSTWFSWVYDFQPQGRYLFPVFLFFGYWLSVSKPVNRGLVFNVIVLSIILVGLYSFVFTALDKIPGS